MGQGFGVNTQLSIWLHRNYWKGSFFFCCLFVFFFIVVWFELDIVKKIFCSSSPPSPQSFGQWARRSWKFLHMCLLVVPVWKLLQHPFWDTWKAIGKPRELTTVSFLKPQDPREPTCLSFHISESSHNGLLHYIQGFLFVKKEDLGGMELLHLGLQNMILSAFATQSSL